MCGFSSKPRRHRPVQEAVPPPPCSGEGGWNLNGRREIDVSDSPLRETLYVKFRLRPGHLLTKVVCVFFKSLSLSASSVSPQPFLERTGTSKGQTPAQWSSTPGCRSSSAGTWSVVTVAKHLLTRDHRISLGGALRLLRSSLPVTFLPLGISIFVAWSHCAAV